MYRHLLPVLIPFFFLAANAPAFSQCNPAALEIPGDGIDQDCDGLDDVFLKLPPFIYAVEGQNVEIYFRNLILSKHPQDYVYQIVTPAGGTSDTQKWAFTPGSNAAGEYPLSVSVRTPNGQTLASASTVLRVSPNEMPADSTTKKLVLFGHSYFDQGYLPKYIWDLTHQPGNPPITFYGKRASWANPLARHEGYGGMMARWFFNASDSPIRYGSKINLNRYFDDVLTPGQRPDWIVFHLDINDFCGYTPLLGTTLQEIDDSIVRDWNLHATRLLDSMRMAAPNAKIAVCISPPPNARESAFATTYGGNPVLNNRWRWQKIINRLVFKNIERYGGREAEGIYLIPQQLDIDDFAEYNPPDARHLDPPDGKIGTHCGYNEIAKTIYAWLKWVENHPTPGGNLTSTFYRDADADGFGLTTNSVQDTSLPMGYAAISGDCDDTKASVYPGAVEKCTNNRDDDCDGTIDEDFVAPNALCVSSLTLQLAASGQAVLQKSEVNSGSWDACGAVSFSLSKTNFSCAEAGQNLAVKLTVTDPSGNSATCQTTVSVKDEISACGGSTDCNNVGISASAGSINVVGLIAPVCLVQVFSSAWTKVFNKSYPTPIGTVNVPNLNAGTYFVKVDFLNSTWGPLCKKEQYVTVQGGSVADCSNISMTTTGSSIKISGMTAPVSFVQVFNSSWVHVFNKTYTAAPDTVSIPNLSAGNYFVKIDFLTSSWSKICLKEQAVVVGQPNLLAQPSDIAFNAARSEGFAQLNWANRFSEQDDYFVVERAGAEPSEYHPILKVNCAGSAGEMLFFEESDKNPLPGQNFYRLRLVSKDGSERYSEQRKVVFPAGFALYPNPNTGDVLHLVLAEFIGQPADLEIRDALGNSLGIKHFEALPAGEILWNTAQFSSGTYFVSLKTLGKRTLVQRFVVQRI